MCRGKLAIRTNHRIWYFRMSTVTPFQVLLDYMYIHILMQVIMDVPYLFISVEALIQGNLNSQLTLQEFQNARGSGVINGPALTTNLSKEQLSDCESQTVLERPVENDSVYALPFFSATLLEKWLSRTRYHEWPSRRLQRKISQMVGHVVPIWHKLSKHKDIEWRIS